MYIYDYVSSVYEAVSEEVENVVVWSEEEVLIEAYLDEY